MEAGDAHERRDSKSQMYEKSLRGIQKIAFITDLTDICNWFLGFCALTWGTSVVLGGYADQLKRSAFIGFSILLFMEGIRFGATAFLRLLGYRLSDFSRWALRYLALFIPLVLNGIVALPALVDCRPLSDSGSLNCCLSIRIFNALILLNTAVFLLGSSITGLMRRRYVKFGSKSLCNYYDNMIYRTTSWLSPVVDLEFAFKIQGSQYRRTHESLYSNGKVAAYYVCENYADLIRYLYWHEKGIEAAETALAVEDGYVREAAAYIVGFWAVLETLEEVKDCKLPLCFHREMLSKLSNIAAESYGSLSIAAAWSFALLLGSVDLEMIGMVACVQTTNRESDLIDILVQCAAELIVPPCPQTPKLPHILMKYSHAHICALRQYIQRIQVDAICESGKEITAAINVNAPSLNLEAQQALLLEKVRVALPPATLHSIGIDLDHADTLTEKGIILQSLDHQLSNLLSSDTETTCDNNYRQKIKRGLAKPSPKPSPYRLALTTFFHIAFPIVCLVVGYIIADVYLVYLQRDLN